MKYLLVDDEKQEEQTLLDNIAEFLWDNGNEVYSRNNFDNENDYKNIMKSCDCLVFLNHSNYSAESFFEYEQEVFHKDLDTEINLNKKIKYVFTISGVYCDAIPSPHKIFHFEKLDQNELKRFFSWCKRLNLFDKQR